jgi:phosphoribosyl-ATP pyrophosphohydrolase/phosphoribosyl-AMP cyclohydrolase
MIITLDNMDSLDFSKGDGLITAIAQQALSGEVLMVAWMNREALRESLTRQEAVFFSRSRQQLWHKGETSGNVLRIKTILADCDRDTLLLRVLPAGPACHTGARSCFIAQDNDGAATLALAPSFLDRLQLVIDHRLAAAANPDDTLGVAANSYTAKLVAQGLRRIAQKVGEEGLEAALAGAAQDRDELRNESADLLFHLLILLRHQGLSLHDVLHTLAARHDGKAS